MKKTVLMAGAALFLVLSGCKKNAGGDTPDPDPTASDLVKDSVLLYAKDIYLWYKNIPASFDARAYADPNAIMEGIRPYSTEPGFTQPVDRWSFAVKQSEWDDISSGISGDFGLGVFFYTNSDLRVSYTEVASPAGKAGIRRGWQIKQINGNAGITPSNANFIIDAVYQSTSSTFLFSRPSGADTSITLTAATYLEQPIYVDSVYSIGGKKAGYLVLNSFLGDTTAISNKLATVFNKFQSQGVQDVIVDLRYNGGGYVALQTNLANYLVPTAGNGDIMETQQFNDKYSDFNETTRFSKKGNLNLSRVFVIVSQNTASASELLINSLKPYMNVQVVGPTATHGKPVGFFPIPVQDWYIFPVSFRTVNKNGEGNYFNGFAPTHQVMDGLNKDWGDISENCLSSVLNFINTGAYARAQVSAQGLNEEVQDGNTELGAAKFKGTIGKRHLQ